MERKIIEKILLPAMIFVFCLSSTHEAAAERPEKANVVQTGLEVLEKSGFEDLKGLRVGLVTNPSGVDRNLRSTIDILNEAPEVNLVALFGPEHGTKRRKNEAL